MELPLYLLFPLSSSLLYVAGILFIKQCSALGVGAWRTSFVSNLATALFFVPVLGFGGQWQPPADWWQPAVVALLFIGGQTFTFIALQKGDVSVATPVLGMKTVMVALFVTGVIGDAVPLKLWISAGLSAAGIAMLNQKEQGRHHHVLSTILLSGCAAASFALFDVLVQKFSPRWGVGRFLPATFLFVSVFSFAFMPFFHGPLRAIPAATWRPLGLGAMFLGLQGLVLICAIGHFGHATSINVVYGARALWSVLAVWLVGTWFDNEERHLSPRILRWRVAGAACMLAAIVLTLV